MDSSIWITIGIICVVVWGFIGWEMYTAPVYPDDYPNKPKPQPDQEYSEDNWNRGVERLGPNPNSQLHECKKCTCGAHSSQ